MLNSFYYAFRDQTRTQNCLQSHVIAPLNLSIFHLQAIALQLSAGSQLGLHAVAALATIVAGCQVEEKEI